MSSLHDGLNIWNIEHVENRPKKLADLCTQWWDAESQQAHGKNSDGLQIPLTRLMIRSKKKEVINEIDIWNEKQKK